MSEHLENAATIRVRVPSGAVRTMDAENVTIHDGLVTAVGHWRHCPERGRLTYTWRAGLVEIRWTREAARAA